MKSIMDTATLNNDIEIPWLGLGVYLTAPGTECQNAVRVALDADYRHVDTAKIYGNEKDVGNAVRESGIAREEIFITTKLWNSDHGYDRAIMACEESLRRLGMPYVDLYLIHWPVEGLRSESWKALIRLQEEGKCRSIGVSNYTVHHLEELLAESPVVPAVNQVEFSPFLYQQVLLTYCRSKGIQLEAYSPLTRGRKFNHPDITAVATKYAQTPAQILIRWCLQHDVVVIPKSAHRHRILENADVFNFQISGEDMALLDSLNENFRVSWNPTNAL